jgi:hypothetical protein
MYHCTPLFVRTNSLFPATITGVTTSPADKNTALPVSWISQADRLIDRYANNQRNYAGDCKEDAETHAQTRS